MILYFIEDTEGTILKNKLPSSLELKNKMAAPTYDSILKELKAKQYQTVYLFHGNESYFIDKLTKFIEKNVLSESEKSFNFSVLYGRDVDHQAVIDTARRYPMMAERQVVILKEAQDMRDLKKLEKYLENPSPTTLLLICHKHKKLDTRTKFGKLLNKKAVVFESKKLYDNQIPDWISKQLKSKSYSINPDAGNLMAEYLGTDLSKISNELEKMVINLPKGTSITIEHVQKNIGISKDYNVFELQNALGARDIVKANRIINYFTANPKENPLPKVTGALYNFFSKVFVLNSLANASENDQIKGLGLRSAWFLKDYKRAAKNYNRSRSENVIALLREYDLKSKGVNRESTSEGELLKELIYKILH